MEIILTEHDAHSKNKDYTPEDYVFDGGWGALVEYNNQINQILKLKEKVKELEDKLKDLT